MTFGGSIETFPPQKLVPRTIPVNLCYRQSPAVLLREEKSIGCFRVRNFWANEFIFRPILSSDQKYLEPVINFVPLESRKYPNVSLSLTMEAWGTRGKSAIQAM
jgi:hypothetical protein